MRAYASRHTLLGHILLGRLVRQAWCYPGALDSDADDEGDPTEEVSEGAIQGLAGQTWQGLAEALRGTSTPISRGLLLVEALLVTSSAVLHPSEAQNTRHSSVP